MKKGLFAMASLLLLISCNDDTKDPKVMGSTSDNSDFMATSNRYTEHNNEIYRAIETGDVSKLDSFMSKDIVDHEGNMGKDIVGIDSVKAELSRMHNYMENLKMDVVTQGTSLDKNYQFTLVHMKGKAKANPWGMPVGKEMDHTLVDVVKIVDDKATDHWSFSSQKDINEMMGMMGDMKPTMKDSTHR